VKGKGYMNTFWVNEQGQDRTRGIETGQVGCGFMRHRRIDPKVSVGCKGCLQLIAILDCEHRL
jgi:hypothetical protein